MPVPQKVGQTQQKIVNQVKESSSKMAEHPGVDSDSDEEKGG